MEEMGCPGSSTEGPSSGSSDGPGGLSPSQRELLERCLHALKHAKNDSHTLAALLLITRLCPAAQLDPETLHRIFEAVGLDLPARLLLTACRGVESSGLPAQELISLAAALLATLSTDSNLLPHPHLLGTIPLLLNILENGQKHTEDEAESGSVDAQTTSSTDEALLCDCYQVINAVCASEKGPEQLLSRGAVPALCRAVIKKQTLSREKGLPLLGRLLSSGVRTQIWNKHSSELLVLLKHISQDFSEASNEARLEMCSRIPLFLPPPGVESENTDCREIVGNLWASLRPLVQGKIKQEHLGAVLVLSACLLDLFGWESVGNPKFCCLLVNRACVEVRMGLEEPPGTEISLSLQNTLTACYRIMEAAMEQACSSDAAPKQTAISGLSLQQSRQVLGALEEAFSAEIYHLKQVEETSYDDPFVFATFRCLCAWLAEETSCLKDDVIKLLPFLMGYAKTHFNGGGEGEGLADWISKMAISNNAHDRTWSRDAALRYLLPALSHLSAEDDPRRELLCLDAPALLVEFLHSGWDTIRARSGTEESREPSLETCCSALLNFTITEPQRVRTDPCFMALEVLLSEALPVLLHKPRLQVLAANCCTLGLMISRLKPASAVSVDSSQRRFFSSVLQFLRTVLDCSQVSVHWDETLELHRLSLQALSSCVLNQPWICTLMRDQDWLRSVCCRLGSDSQVSDQLEELRCALEKRQ
ncbi:neurochondrin [Danio aesculapii]|uniref:neurochondrin n=1 Tax=Danio aesculapii TaxID=1142201 RepID=UPI0024BF38BA|nr:neurochondrin [Danio aesculapii]